MSNPLAFLGNVEDFVKNIIDSLKQDGIDVSPLNLDHLCYRVETQEDYLAYQQKLATVGSLLSEKEIGGRLISSYKLDNPVYVLGKEIYVIELPAPKKGSSYQRGLEHAEFVIEDSFEDFMHQHPNIQFDTKGMDKPVNADIAINHDTFTVKFHHHSLEYVIENEQ